MDDQGSTGRKIYRVAEITRLIKSVLEDEVGSVWIEGELSNVRYQSSGHIYFTLKDDSAQIGAALFRGNQRGLAFTLKDGLQVRVQGDVTVYEPRGQYQVIVRQVEEAGKGSLQEAFEKLKAKLQAEGLFDAARKRPIPILPQHVGIVTSPTGAAIRDILNVLNRRFPNLHVMIAPARVQGEGAAAEIAAGIDLLNEHGVADVLIVGRGGGSLEDLWSFNEEIVARAIARSVIPVISAVGHEIDFTISDFVADLRAPTPSAAAELVVGQKEMFEERIRQAARHLAAALRERSLSLRARYTAASRSYVFREPRNLVRQYRERLTAFLAGMTHVVQTRARRQQQMTDELALRLTHRMQMWRQVCAQDLRRLDAQLRTLNPSAVLERGYSVTLNAAGSVIRSAEQVSPGDELTTQVARGSIVSEVKDKEMKR